MSTDAHRSILIALESGADVMALEVAAELATLVRGTLQGVFMENPELLRLAQLPFAREVSLNANVARRLHSEQLEREFRVEAERARRRLEQHARRHRLQWSFRVERGAVMTAVAGGLDIAVFGRSPGPAATGTVVVPFNGSPGSRRALELASAITPAGSGLLLLLPANDPQLRAEATALLGARAPYAEALAVTAFAPQQLLGVGRQYRCRMLLLGADLPLTPPQFEQLLENSRCPVALVR